MGIIKKIDYVFDSGTKVKIIVVLLMIILGAALELLGVSVILPLVDLGMKPDAFKENDVCNFISNVTGITEATTILLIMVSGMILIYITKNIYMAYMNSVIYGFSMNVRRSLATRMMTVFMRQPYSYFLQENSSELIRCVNSDTVQFYEMLSNCFLVISNGLVAGSLVVYLLYTNWVMTLSVVVLLALCAGAVFLKIRKTTRVLGVENQRLNSLLIKTLQQSFEGIKEIKVMGREHFFVDAYDDVYKESANIVRKYNLANLLPKYLIEAVTITGILGFLAINIVVNGNYMEVLPQLAAFAVAAFRLLPAVNALYMYSNTIVYNMASVDLIYKDLKETENLEQDYYRNLDKETVKLEFNREISLHHITFGYEGSSKTVLENIDLVIRKGDSVAFIGPSGGGKTTLADLLLGLLIPREGQVLVDGIDVTTNMEGWIENIGYIPQNIYLLDDSIRKNVAFGIASDQIDDNEVWEALNKAQLKEFVESLELGIDTVVGERGARISGGQRQRIGIARALYKNPSILVFDEATSALDSETEKEVICAIDNLHGSKTIIMIAHRLTTIQNCDVVYSVGNKRVQSKEMTSSEK